jgi:thiol-disulfide isomerase/thioredoxin
MRSALAVSHTGRASVQLAVGRPLCRVACGVLHDDRTVSGSAASTSSPAAPQRLVAAAAAAAVTENYSAATQVVHTHVPWFERACEGWSSASSLAQLQAAIGSGAATGKLVVIDIFTGACPACKAAFPKMCALAQVRQSVHKMPNA